MFRKTVQCLVWVMLVVDARAQVAAHPCTKSPCLKVNSGGIVGEIRTVAFGGDSAVLIDELAAQGWVECAGQSMIRSDFVELWRVLGTSWGAADRTNVFYLPDLRGLFLRGWQHGRTAPPRYANSPYSGERDMSARVAPRPEAGDAGGAPGATGDKVGTLQAEQFRDHTHPFTMPRYNVNFQPAYDRNAPTITAHRQYSNETDSIAPGGGGGAETHPANAYVMFVIYVGRPAKVVAATATDPGTTGRVIRR